MQNRIGDSYWRTKEDKCHNEIDDACPLATTAARQTVFSFDFGHEFQLTTDDGKCLNFLIFFPLSKEIRS